jgi:acetoacetyl-CoA synthetase
MMWNFLVSALLTPAAAVLYDGNPGNDGMDMLWELAERTRTTCFGTSAAFIHVCMKAGIDPAAGRDLTSLTAVGSTGSPLSPEGFRWIYDRLGADTWLFSMSGGSDVCSAFVGGTPLRPVALGELQARALGADVRAFDAAENEVVDEMGELVVVQPLPSMPVGFWGDDTGERYRESYFATYPAAWRHGDWIRITPEGGAVIYGRSDSTINRGGIRMGSAEIYRAALAVVAVQDALVVDVPDRSGIGEG